MSDNNLLNKKKLLNKKNNINKNKIIKNNKQKKNKQIQITHLDFNDYEMNNLRYNDAIKYDKRTFFNYYISLLKTKHLILSSFIPINDYNLISIKISLFWLSLSSYFAINGFFFNDETMHKIYKN